MTQTTPTTAKGGDASVLAPLNAFALKGSAYKETLREKLDDKRADKEKAAVASSPEGLCAILKSLKTVRVCVRLRPFKKPPSTVCGISHSRGTAKKERKETRAADLRTLPPSPLHARDTQQEMHSKPPTSWNLTLLESLLKLLPCDGVYE